MNTVTMDGLLQADEEQLRNALRADAAIDRNRRLSADRLNEEYSRLLLRYNAMCIDEPRRQALSDCMIAPLRELTELLLAGTAKKEITKRRLRSGAVIALLLGAVCILAGILIQGVSSAAGWILAAVGAVCAFAAGRLWYGEREVRVRTELDADLIWLTLKKSVETLDRKMEEFLQQEQAGAFSPADVGKKPSEENLPSGEELQLYADLLEALCSGRGDFALLKLRNLPAYLSRRGIELQEYQGSNAELFDLLPTKNAPATQRPAMLSGGRLILPGKATETANGRAGKGTGL